MFGTSLPVVFALTLKKETSPIEKLPLENPQPPVKEQRSTLEI